MGEVHVADTVGARTGNLSTKVTRRDLFGFARSSAQERVPLPEFPRRRGLLGRVAHDQLRNALEAIPRILSGLVTGLDKRRKQANHTPQEELTVPVDWDDKFEYLRESRSLYHNRDYWEFLVRTVWQLHERPQRVADFGCGFGWLGLFLMPLLAPGSTYTGLDSSEVLVAKGRELLTGLPYEAQLLHGDVHSAPLDDDAFDVAIAHTVLMHLPDPEQALREMIRVTRHGGMVIACDANRNAANALLHIHETDEQEHVPLSMLQAMNANVRRRTGVDYNIGMKMPVLMHKAGLRDVQARIGDAVRLLLPPVDTPAKERLFGAICDDGLGHLPSDDDGIGKWKRLLLDRGASENDADAEIRRETERDFDRKGRSYHTVYPGLLTFSFGTVCKEI